MKVTAETITNGQVREMIDENIAVLRRPCGVSLDERCRLANENAVFETAIANADIRESDRMLALERCADAWNTRKGMA